MYHTPESANAAFYEAHESRDLVLMSTLWEHSDRAVCVHPGWPILNGWAAVHQSWSQILGGPGRNQFILTNETWTLTDDVAWVTLDENLVEGANTGTVAATNIYANGPDGWKLICHHGSPVMLRA